MQKRALKVTVLYVQWFLRVWNPIMLQNELPGFFHSLLDPFTTSMEKFPNCKTQQLRVMLTGLQVRASTNSLDTASIYIP